MTKSTNDRQPIPTEADDTPAAEQAAASATAPGPAAHLAWCNGEQHRPGDCTGATAYFAGTNDDSMELDRPAGPPRVAHLGATLTGGHSPSDPPSVQFTRMWFGADTAVDGEGFTDLPMVEVRRLRDTLTSLIAQAEMVTGPLPADPVAGVRRWFKPRPRPLVREGKQGPDWAIDGDVLRESDGSLHAIVWTSENYPLLNTSIHLAQADGYDPFGNWVTTEPLTVWFDGRQIDREAAHRLVSALAETMLLPLGSQSQR